MALDRPAIEGGAPVRQSPMSVWPRFTEEEVRLVTEVLRSGRLVSRVGGVTRRFEEMFASYLGVRRAVAVCNGTAALHTMLAAAGIGVGDEVITTPFTFASTATSILHQNAVPVFGDIDRETLNLDPSTVERLISDRTRAILVVHLAGHPAEMDELARIARDHNLLLLEDAAQALGAEYRGRKAGTLGDAAAFSFYMTKTITTGEGGMVATDDPGLAEKAAVFRDHGQVSTYEFSSLGYNYRMTELQAALGVGQLRRLDELLDGRRRVARIYTEVLEGVDAVELPAVRPWVKHSWNIFQVLLDLRRLRVGRDRVVEAVRRENVLISVSYPRPVYMERVFLERRGYGKGCPWSCPYGRGAVAYSRGLAPVAEDVASRVVTLPTHPWLSDEDAYDIAAALAKVVKYYS